MNWGYFVPVFIISLLSVTALWEQKALSDFLSCPECGAPPNKCTTQGRFSTAIELRVQVLSTSPPDSVFLIWPSGCHKVGATGHKGLHPVGGTLEWLTLSDGEYISTMDRLVLSLGDTFVLCGFFSFYFFVFKNNLSLLCFPLLLFTLAYWQSKLKALYPISFSTIFSWKSLGISLAVPLLSLTCLMLSIVSGLTVWYGHAPSPQLQLSWSDRQISKQPHSSLVRCTPSLAKSLSFQYLKPLSKKQICTASTLLCIFSCAGCSHPHT